MPAKSAFDGVFHVGVTPDFYTEAKGRFENILEHKLTGLPGLDWQPMPPQTGNVATSEALNQFDAMFSLELKNHGGQCWRGPSGSRVRDGESATT